jgi:hypothetical protein
MKLLLILLTLAGSTIATPLKSDALANHGLDQLWLDVAKNPKSYSKSCTKKTVARRREWCVTLWHIQSNGVLILHRSTLKRSEKLNYINAVQCMGKTKARTPAAIASGAKNRYDDFVVTHILLTQYTHGNVRSYSHNTPLLLISGRAISSHGIATLCGLGNRLYVMNADIGDTYRTTTGHCGQMILVRLLFSMAVTRVYLETENMFLDATQPAYLIQADALLRYLLRGEAAVLLLDLSRSESIFVASPMRSFLLTSNQLEDARRPNLISRHNRSTKPIT